MQRYMEAYQLNNEYVRNAFTFLCTSIIKIKRLNNVYVKISTNKKYQS